VCSCSIAVNQGSVQSKRKAPQVSSSLPFGKADEVTEDVEVRKIETQQKKPKLITPSEDAIGMLIPFK
jgi:hypothetical protein